jgi:hypothetical protein
MVNVATAARSPKIKPRIDAHLIKDAFPSSGSIDGSAFFEALPP